MNNIKAQSCLCRWLVGAWLLGVGLPNLWAAEATAYTPFDGALMCTSEYSGTIAPAANTAYFYCRDVNGVTKFYWVDSAGVHYPVATEGGALDFSNALLMIPTGTVPVSTDCDAAGEAGRMFYDSDATTGQRLYVCEGASGWKMQGDGGGQAFPVGSVFLSVVSTNPATLLGYGTWSAIGTGRVLVGIDAGDANFDTVKETGGAKTVSSSAQTFAGAASTVVVNHVHVTTVNSSTTDGTWASFDSSTTSGTGRNHTSGNPTVGGAANYTPAGTNTAGAATSVVQPYYVVYMWERTA